MNLEGARIFMTGGAGFVGSHLVRELVTTGARVTIYDNYSTGSDENLEGIANVTVVRGDILDYEPLRAAMEGHDAVSHQAAQLEITRSIGDPVHDLTTNTIGTLNVLKAVSELGIPKMVEASSAGVYGQATSAVQAESDATDPNWEYGVSKLACEKYSAIFCERTTGLSVASLRYAIVYGEREWYGRVLTLFLKRALEGQSPVVFGAGDQIRDFVYAGDIAVLHRACFETEFDGHLVLNGSTGVGTSVLELADAICDLAGNRLEPIYDNVAEGEVSQLAGGRMRLPSELMAMRMSYERAHATVGWEPKVSLVEGLEREWRWVQDNPHRWNEMSY